MWDHNSKWQIFVDRLKINKVEMRPLWSGKSNPAFKEDDICMFSLHIHGQRIAIYSCVAKDYGGDGFGLWLEAPASHTETIQAIVDGTKG